MMIHDVPSPPASDTTATSAADSLPAAASVPSAPADAPAAAATRAGSILPGLAMALLIVGGISAFVWVDWRDAHPLPDVPDDVEPVLKVPGEIPKALRRR